MHQKSEKIWEESSRAKTEHKSVGGSIEVGDEMVTVTGLILQLADSGKAELKTESTTGPKLEIHSLALSGVTNAQQIAGTVLNLDETNKGTIQSGSKQWKIHDGTLNFGQAQHEVLSFRLEANATGEGSADATIRVTGQLQMQVLPPK